MYGRRDEGIVSAFSGRLLKGETIQWSGRPGQGIRFMARDVFLIPFSILWCGFTIFWVGLAIKISAPLGFVLWGSMFVLIGLFMVFGRFLLDAWVRSKIAYAVTDNRILISRSGPWPSFKALQLDRLPEAAVSEGSKGSGTIRFGQHVSIFGGFSSGGFVFGGFKTGGFSGWIPSLDPTPQFIDIDDVVRVYAFIQESIQRGR